MAHLVFDETSNDDNTIGGYGFLFVDDITAQLIVEEALSDLKNDPDITNPITRKNDERTLKRNYFHACEDSKNAHSWLCKSINKYLKGQFVCYFYKKNKQYSSLNDLYKISLDSICLELFSVNEHHVLSFEQRNGLSSQSLKKWYSDLELEVMKALYQVPYHEAIFNSIDFCIETKQSPSVQICDFLLWAALRAFQGKTEWWKRLIASSVSMTPESLKWASYDLIFKNYSLRTGPNLYQITIPLSGIPYKKLFEYYTFAEEIIDIYSRRINSSLAHIQNEINKFGSKKRFNKTRVIDGSRLALRIIDTARIIDGRDEEYIKKIICVKQALGYLSTNDPRTLDAREYVTRLLLVNGC